MKSHRELPELERLFPFIREYQVLATRHGIRDIFQDNGGKLLQMLLITGLTCMKGREGNDAIDEDGHEYELKSVNLSLTKSFSTHHHLNQIILKKYRSVEAWFFAVYLGIELQVIYRMPPKLLESYFADWKRRLREEDRTHLNNPKIPVKFVMQQGTVAYQAPGAQVIQLLEDTVNPRGRAKKAAEVFQQALKKRKR